MGNETGRKGDPLSTDGFFLVHERKDGLYVSVFPPVGSGRPVSPGDLRIRLSEFGVEVFDLNLLTDIARRAHGQPHRAAALPMAESEYTVDTAAVKTEVRVSEDGMRAWLTFIPAADETPQAAENRIYASLVESGVVHGLFRSLIREIANAGRPIHEVVVAEGMAAEQGHDGRIEFYFDPDPAPVPKLKGNGTVDHRERGVVQNVEIGTKLLRIIPETQGFPGKRVDGGLDIAQTGKAPPAVRAGTGVEILTDGKTFVAAVAGHVIFSDGMLRVTPAFVVEGDIDYKTGNIEMKGSIVVNGTVRNGFSLKAEGDIEVFGAVEGATVITSAGSIYIHGGIAGGGTARVGASRDIMARFIERASVVAGKSVIVEDSIYDSQVSAKNDVEVTRGKGQIIGGVTRAERRIRAKVLGSPGGKVTEARIELIEAPRLYARLSELDRILRAMDAEYQRLNMLMDRYPRETIGAEAALDAIKSSMEELVARKRINAAEKRELEKRLANSGSGVIEVSEQVYEQVLIAIGRSAARIQKMMTGISFFREGDAVKWKTGQA